MAKIFVQKSTAVFSIAVLVLMMLCVGLLVALMKGKAHHEKSLADKIVSGPSFNTIDKNDHTKSTTTTTTTTEKQEVTTTEIPEPWHDFRLPQHIRPVNYDLMLHPDLKANLFDGKVTIEVELTKPTNYFIVHIYKLNVTKSVVQRKSDLTEMKIADSPFYYDPNEFWVVKTERKLNPNENYFLVFEFQGSLIGDIVGFYKSKYKESRQNQTRYLATSKFQPTYARRAFPCFDEPNFKSTFAVTLVHDSQYHSALSNMPLQSQQQRNDGLMVTTFEKSVEMVTYLACFIVSDFGYKESSTAKNKPFRVYATPDRVEKTKYALDVGVKILNHYEDYFQLDYPLPKQDMVAIPDFVSGAMEHWGVITFRETNLLYDPHVSSPQNKQRIVAVIAHEMAHMWFGNLVTMKWWDDLWLNEGFASYIEYKGMRHVEPTWDIEDQFITIDLQPVMHLDATLSSHPIVQIVSHPDEITEIFDTISYSKGASVLRMLEYFIGKETFRKGVTMFLKKYQYDNARTNDLWKELTEATSDTLPADYNIARIMDTWTKQMGYPYITVRRSPVNRNRVKIRQQRYLMDPAVAEKHKNDSPYGYVWDVPLSYVTSKGDTKLIWIHNSSSEIEIPDLGENEWLKFNDKQYGYYLVDYDRSDWKKFTDLLNKNHETLFPADRSNLLFDASMLTKANLLDYDVMLAMMEYLLKERHLIPWETSYEILVFLAQMLELTETNTLMMKYITYLTEPVYKDLGWQKVDTDNHTDELLRTTIIGLACYSGNRMCIKEAVTRLRNWMDGEEIPTNLRSLVYRYGMSEVGREKEWDFMWNRYLMEQSAQERTKLLYGLAHVREPSLIQRYLTYAMDESMIRRQDFFTVLGYIAGNPVGRSKVWSFLRFNWSKLVERFTLNDRYLGRVVKKICDYFTTEFELHEMKLFFDMYPEAGAGTRARKQALENVQNNIKWLKNHQKTVHDFLEGKLVKKPWENLRLPKHIRPLNYDLTFHPNLTTDTFTGRVTIALEVWEPTRVFLVHVNNLNILSTTLRKVDKSAVLIREPFYYKPNQFWVIQANEELPKKQKYFLEFEFHGSLVGSLVGFYKSVYTDTETNQTRYIATSQFQSTYARRAFPCFDEPGFKTEFTVTLVHEPAFLALSNMPAKETFNISNGLQATTFEKSKKMVTYLLCVVVCDYKYKEAITEGGIKIRVFAPPDKYRKTDYSLKAGAKILTFFEKYYNISYPLPKVDMIAIPDFRAGAMENWGLITYREGYLLYDERESSSYDKLRIVVTVAHELAHMWFGNLVTMRWWTDLWLNEGFASYVQFKGMGMIEPSWDVMDQFLDEVLTRVVESDATITSHPIVQPVDHPDEISELFDAISYCKGSSILRMLEFLMGEEDFRVGVSTYLKKYAYSNADTEDLWRELTMVSSKKLNISRIMNTWTRQMGYPYINVTRDTTDPRIFVVRQQRFLTDPDSVEYDSSVSNHSYIWEIPFSYRTNEGGNIETYWLCSSQPEKIVLDLSKPEDTWVKFNVNNTGYYVVNYDVNQWQRFIQLLENNHEEIGPSDRANLINDAFLLARAGYLNYETALDLSLYLKNERHLVPWSIAQTALTYITNILEDTKVSKALKEFISSLTEDVMKELGWEDVGGHLERRTRISVISLACSSGSELCLKQAVERLEQWRSDPLTHKIPSNLRSLVYTFGMKYGGTEETWNFMWKQYILETSSQEQRKLLHGLSSTTNPKLLKRLMEYGKDENKIRSQDFFMFLNFIIQNPLGRPMVWKFYREEWKYLVNRFTLNDGSLGGILNTMATYFVSAEAIHEMEEFFKKYPEAGASERARKQALETANNNLKWIQKYKSVVQKWLLKPWHNYRLPNHIKPIHYDLLLHPNLTSNTFTGEVTILVHVSKPTNYFLTHLYKLNVSESSVRKETHNREKLELLKSFEYKPNQFWVVLTKDTLPTGNYYLHFRFSGSLLGGLIGFFKSFYVNSRTGERRFLATSQFQSTYARRAFPAFDEPNIKSRFKVTLIHEPDYIALSNMPAENTEMTTNGLRKTQFKTTIDMPTYLLCVTVCDFKSKRTITPGGTEFGVYAAPDRYQYLDYALEAGVKILNYFEKYFNISYPLPKIDMIALPDISGAMENWGLITFNEKYLLYRPQECSSHDQLRIVGFIAHELAHMWFGNLVTMEWWTDLWLNEGFASYIEYKGTDSARPSWNIEDQFLLEDIHPILETDAIITSHPIVQTVNHPDEISGLFDAISYSKGAAVLRMLEFIMGSEDFKKGVSSYLLKHKLGNAETEELWTELSMASSKNLDISQIMNTWTGQMGYPYINITRDKVNPHTFHVQQQRFLISPESAAVADDDSPFGYVWEIPLSYHSSKSKNPQIYWLRTDKEEQLDIALEDGIEGWFKFNVNQFGFYMINYEENDWQKIIDLLKKNHKVWSPSNRANVISDSFFLARAGYLKYSVPLELSTYLKDERHLVPWETANMVLSYISKPLENSESKFLLKKYIKSLTADVVAELGWSDENDDHLKKRTRVTVLNLACGVEDEECLNNATELLRQWKDGKNISPDLRSIVYRYGISHSNSEELWNYMWKRYLDEQSSHEKMRFLNALSCTKNENILLKYLEISKNDSIIRTHDYFTVLNFIANNPVGKNLLWEFYTNEWEYLVNRFTLNNQWLGRLLKTMSRRFATEDKLKQMEEFFLTYPEAGASKQARKEALENVNSNVKWVHHHLPKIVQWLQKYYKEETNTEEFKVTEAEKGVF
ncbi:uncharacterized protein LOC143229476 isoform X3 [Tachypleus tridentatus]|uniref:uncharacterized protein LOC143229476 isoform X3 n=1 Tax=Tachypleus tridentatus TaxID=6853 RepID=UPI003FD13D78